MFKNKTIFLFMLVFLVSSCGGTWDSIKRGLTGQKATSTDEFLVKKKDPLILPPDFEELPTPADRRTAEESITSFEKKLENITETEIDTSSSSSTEEAIMKKIKKQ